MGECEDPESTSSSSSQEMVTSTKKKKNPTIGTYYPFNGGSPQLGYFVPITLPPSAVALLTPQTDKKKRETLESRRSTSYSGSISPTQASGSRRSSVTNSTQPVAPPENPSTSQVDLNAIERLETPESPPQTTTQTILQKSGGLLRSLSLKGASPGARKKEKRHTVALHEDGSATFSDCRDGRRRRKDRHRIRPFHSMNETIEVLADPVVEIVDAGISFRKAFRKGY
ncbi:hypothetical protein DMENIID0001_054820 [Sergentomyia squamirostris]